MSTDKECDNTLPVRALTLMEARVTFLANVRIYDNDGGVIRFPEFIVLCNTFN